MLCCFLGKRSEYNVYANTSKVCGTDSSRVCGFTEMNHLGCETFSVKCLEGFGYCSASGASVYRVLTNKMINDLIRNWPPYCVYHNCIVLDKYISVFGKFIKNEPNYRISVLLARTCIYYFKSALVPRLNCAWPASDTRLVMVHDSALKRNRPWTAFSLSNHEACRQAKSGDADEDKIKSCSSVLRNLKQHNSLGIPPKVFASLWNDKTREENTTILLIRTHRRGSED